MELIIILSAPFIFICLEVYYDTLVNKSKRVTDLKKRRKYSQRYHILQQFIYFIIFSYGIYIGYLLFANSNYNIISWFIPSITFNYIALRIWLFNAMYNTINDLAKNYTNQNELYDRALNKLLNFIIKKFSIRSIGLFMMFFKIFTAGLYFLTIIYILKQI